ncbi:MAG: hypothetical protein LBB40_02575 [Holophagales bacterium]|jgi:hypothetical protein|nr:hypothetical protein [Holophagales bacterium]
MWRMTFPGDLEYLLTISEEEAEAICLKHCQNDDNWKVFCFQENCPLGRTELQRLYKQRIQLAKAYDCASDFKQSMISS